MVGRVCKLDYSRPGKPTIDWDDPAAKEDLVSDLVNDAPTVWQSRASCQWARSEGFDSPAF